MIHRRQFRPRASGPRLFAFQAVLVGALFLVGCGGTDDAAPDPPPGEEATVPAEGPPEVGLDPPLDPPTDPGVDRDPDVPAPDSTTGDTGVIREARPPDDTLTEAQDVRREEGVVVVTGTGARSFPVLRTEALGDVGLSGPMEAELIRLSGIRVRVSGSPGPTAVGPGIRVSHYELLEIEGRIPHLGILLRDEEGRWILHLEGDDTVPLAGLPGGQMQAGMKIWVVGAMGADGHLAVESYGIVAPAGG